MLIFIAVVCVCSQREIKPLERMEWLQSLTVRNLEFQAMHNHFKVRVSYLWREKKTFLKGRHSINFYELFFPCGKKKKSEPITSGS